MKVTQYPEIDKLLEKLLSEMKAILGEKLIGLYLYGSLVWGDFDYEISDIDLLAALSSDLDEKEFNELKKIQDNIVREYKKFENRLEIAYMTLTALKTFKTQKSPIAIVSPGEPFHIKDAGKDWSMNWYFVRENSKTLFGPDPKTIIEPISKEEFIQAVKDQVKDWPNWILKNHKRKFQAYAILTMCRTLYAYRNGEQVSKKQAAFWAQKELLEWSSLIQNALQWREDWKNENVDHEAIFQETSKFVDYINKLMST